MRHGLGFAVGWVLVRMEELEPRNWLEILVEWMAGVGVVGIVAKVFEKGDIGLDGRVEKCDGVRSSRKGEVAVGFGIRSAGLIFIWGLLCSHCRSRKLSVSIRFSLLWGRVLGVKKAHPLRYCGYHQTTRVINDQTPSTSDSSMMLVVSHSYLVGDLGIPPRHHQRETFFPHLHDAPRFLFRHVFHQQPNLHWQCDKSLEVLSRFSQSIFGSCERRLLVQC